MLWCGCSEFLPQSVRARWALPCFDCITCIRLRKTASRRNREKGVSVSRIFRHSRVCVLTPLEFVKDGCSHSAVMSSSSQGDPDVWGLKLSISTGELRFGRAQVTSSLAPGFNYYQDEDFLLRYIAMVTYPADFTSLESTIIHGKCLRPLSTMWQIYR